MLEKKAGLKTSAVRNILSGASKKPSAETLQAIANALECSIYDLMDDEIVPSIIAPQKKPQFNRYKVDDIGLFHSCVKTTTEQIEQEKLECTLENLSFFICQTYVYSKESNQKRADLKFIRWLINEKLSR